MELWLNKEALVPGSLPGSMVTRGKVRKSMDVVQELRGQVTATPGGSPPRRVFVVRGPGGSGTSTMARCLSKAVLDSTRNIQGSARPRMIRVDTRRCKGPHEVVVQLFRAFDPDFTGQGFSTTHLLTLFLRRVRVDAGVGLIWFDNVERVRALDNGWNLFVAAHAMPGDPSIFFSGDYDPTESNAEETGGDVMRVTLEPFDPDDLYLVLEEMVREAFVTLPAPSFLVTVRDRMLARGWGISVAASLFRSAGESAERRGSPTIEERDLPSGRKGPRMRDPGAINTMVMEGLRETSLSQSMHMGPLRKYLRVRCVAEGIGLPSPSQLRRHLAKLERMHLIERFVKMGGDGGTTSLIALAPSLSGSIRDGSAPISGLTPPLRLVRPSESLMQPGAVSLGPGRPARASLSRAPAPLRSVVHA